MLIKQTFVQSSVFEEKRQAAHLTLLYYINAVEKEFTDKRRAGDPLGTVDASTSTYC